MPSPAATKVGLVIGHSPAVAYGLRYPASYCPQCETPVAGWRKLPLAGWLLLKGRCAACDVAIGWRY
ncbi:MAG: prepilin peptidase [Burkholderiaceae bacterium]|nr:prepilin peptidase [Burkholderiaceae bacterium]